MAWHDEPAISSLIETIIIHLEMLGRHFRE